MVKLVYSPKFAMGSRWFKLHVFDAQRAVRAYGLVAAHFGANEMSKMLVKWAEEPVSREHLLLAHTEEYVGRFRTHDNMSDVLGLPWYLRWVIPGFALDSMVTTPMMVATAGTVEGARQAIQSGLTINFSGGFHHARSEAGEGFCPLTDIGIAVKVLRQEGLLKDHQAVVYIDTDAHMGDGVHYVFMDDPLVWSLDAFNCEIYPCWWRNPSDSATAQWSQEAFRRVNMPIPLAIGTGDEEYLGRLGKALPEFLDRVAKKHPIGLAIYNAGTDVIAGDKLGGLGLTKEGVLTRDMLVLDGLVERGIPTLMLPSGGYTDTSHWLLARTVKAACEKYGATEPSTATA